MASTTLFPTADIRAVVFDLDNTLLDHAAAEAYALRRVLQDYAERVGFGEYSPEAEEYFLRVYRAHNERLWHDLALRRITPDELRRLRFSVTLADVLPHLSAHDREKFGNGMGEAYMRLYSYHWQLVDGAEDVLSALQDRFKLGVITNGFREQQRGKLARFGWDEGRFHIVVLSDEVGVMKPHREIFAIAEERLQCAPSELVYVGDNHTSDVEGAKNAGWRAIWYNPARQNPPASSRYYADATVGNLYEITEVLFGDSL